MHAHIFLIFQHHAFTACTEQPAAFNSLRWLCAHRKHAARPEERVGAQSASSSAVQFAPGDGDGGPGDGDGGGPGAGPGGPVPGTWSHDGFHGRPLAPPAPDALSTTW